MATLKTVKHGFHKISLGRYFSGNSEKIPQIFELRTYHIKPKNLKPFLELGSQKLHLRTAYSALLGYWTAELGGLNQAVHIWPYESCEQRTQVRKAVAGDSTWITDYLSKMLPMIRKQENEVMVLLPGIKLQIPTKSGQYELQRFVLNTAIQNRVVELTSLYEAYKEKYSSHNSILIGAFRTIFGVENNVYFLWQHQSLDSGLAAKIAFAEDKHVPGLHIWKDLKQISSVAMSPTSISPLK